MNNKWLGMGFSRETAPWWGSRPRKKELSAPFVQKCKKPNYQREQWEQEKKGSGLSYLGPLAPSPFEYPANSASVSRGGNSGRRKK